MEKSVCRWICGLALGVCVVGGDALAVDGGTNPEDSLEPCKTSATCPSGEVCAPKQAQIKCEEKDEGRSCVVDWTSVCRHLDQSALDDLQVGCAVGGMGESWGGAFGLLVGAMLLLRRRRR